MSTCFTKMAMPIRDLRETTCPFCIHDKLNYYREFRHTKNFLILQSAKPSHCTSPHQLSEF